MPEMNVVVKVARRGRYHNYVEDVPVQKCVVDNPEVIVVVPPAAGNETGCVLWKGAQKSFYEGTIAGTFDGAPKYEDLAGFMLDPEIGIHEDAPCLCHPEGWRHPLYG
jgi:hypothetical protein